MARLRFLRTAEADLDEIWRFIAVESGSTDIADQVLDELYSRIAVLRRFPMAGRHRDELRPGMRSLAVGDYVVFYRILKNGSVTITQVAHGNRDLRQFFLN